MEDPGEIMLGCNKMRKMTFAVGCTLADGCIKTSPIMVALLVPSPEARRCGVV